MSYPAPKKTLPPSFILLCLSSMLLALMAVGGCFNPKEPVDPKAPVEKTKNITLEVWTLQLNAFSEPLTAMFKAYEAQHPGVHIKWVDVPFSEGEKRTLTAMMSGVVPDVVNLNPDFSAVLATRKALVNMNDYVSPETRASYLPVAWQAVSLKDYAFGLPWYLTSSITFYNKALVKKAGWSAPPKDFAELDTFSKDLQRATANGQPAYAVMPTIAESGNFLKELARVGVPLYDPATGTAVFADNGAGLHLQYWVEQYQSHRVPAESITEGHRAAVNQYQSNTLAMLMVGPSFIKILKENAQETLKETDVAPQFPQGAKVVDFATMLLAVPIKSRHPKEAVDLAVFLTNETNQTAFAEAAPVLPSITKALQAPRYQTTAAKGLEDRARAISAQQLVAARAAYQIRPQQRQLNEIINYYVQSALLGKIHADTAMSQAQSEFNALLVAPATK